MVRRRKKGRKATRKHTHRQEKARAGRVGWPGKGWTKEIHERKRGASKGREDCCWITPEKHFEFWSKVEVDKFLVALKATDGDERKAEPAMNENR